MLKTKYIFIAFAFLILLLSGCSGVRSVNPPETVPHVDLAKYSGVWYEIARLPNSFQKGCVDSRATYTILDDGKVGVLNECVKEGKPKSARGKARVVDPNSNAKLEVSFFWPFYGDYWIIELEPEYRYVVVSEPERRYLWILARDKTLPGELYEKIVAGLREKGFDTSKLIKYY